MAARLFVVWKLTFQNAKRFKILLELEIDDLVTNLHVLNGAQIVRRRAR